MRTLLTLALVCSSAVAAPVPKEVRKPDPFAGKWTLRMIIVDGKTINSSKDGVSWNIDGEHALTIAVAKSEEKVAPAPVNLPMFWAFSSNGPPTTQLRFDTARNNIEYGTEGQARAGKYSLDGDTLTICLAFPGSPRPERIERSDNTTTWVLRRVAK